MDRKKLQSRRIDDIVDQDHVRAYVLYYFGIRFYEYSEKTLEQACHDHGLNVAQVVQELESAHQLVSEETLPLGTYPVDLIIEYLKHAHFLFVKKKLPFILKLVDEFNPKDKNYASIARDLKTLFPLFIEDFIHHIYEEEDTLFRYIRLLDEAHHKGKINGGLYYAMEKSSLRRFAMEHEAHDDEMEGIRRITLDYHTDLSTPLHVKVIYSELIAFEKSLQTHARIENEILFPKGMVLENKVKNLIAEKIQFN